MRLQKFSESDLPPRHQLRTTKIGLVYMRKVMEFPTEWTMPDPAEDADTKPEERVAASQQPRAATPKDEIRMAGGAVSVE